MLTHDLEIRKDGHRLSFGDSKVVNLQRKRRPKQEGYQVRKMPQKARKDHVPKGAVNRQE